ncbi:Zn(II)2Cys6 transcription factor domain-containing protein [Aspergillus novofumigatus IBT 16806]|uniref:C6 zinc finger domain protein n=1 Tax=Aspergillus novofumigatus (strain IBT 16806) TaxID=1392255 RepID=A0A2I1CJ86_ASPN1|nr:C6 zinc finger domain protein [Aspergillus novofumigatus IBT 16806]PKX97670.1 C6 zinc finger domain protein [Aspergillus novofumigatus IBT 16806]
MSDPFKVRYLAPASSSDGQIQPAKRTLKSIRSRRNASLSCSACRLRKAKCQGGPPCENCVKYKTECRREEDKDGRRQTSLKRKLIELEKDRHLLVRLLETIRVEEDVKVTQLLNLIRSNAPPDETRPSVAEGRQPSRRRIRPDTGQVVNEDISSAHDAIEPRPRQNIMAIRSLCNAT